MVTHWLLPLYCWHPQLKRMSWLRPRESASSSYEPSRISMDQIVTSSGIWPTCCIFKKSPLSRIDRSRWSIFSSLTVHDSRWSIFFHWRSTILFMVVHEKLRKCQKSKIPTIKKFPFAYFCGFLRIFAGYLRIFAGMFSPCFFFYFGAFWTILA